MKQALTLSEFERAVPGPVGSDASTERTNGAQIHRRFGNGGIQRTYRLHNFRNSSSSLSDSVGKVTGVTAIYMLPSFEAEYWSKEEKTPVMK